MHRTRQCARRVLIVEDDPDNRILLRQLLQLKGYSVETAHNGRDALRLIAASGPPCVAIVDLSMPVMGGVEFAYAAGQLRVRRFPLVVVSGKANLHHVPNAIAQFTKPPVIADLLKQLERCCGDEA